MRTTFTVEEADNGYIISETITGAGIVHISSSVAINKLDLIEQIAKRLEVDRIECRYRDEGESNMSPITTGICYSENGLKEYEYTYHVFNRKDSLVTQENILNKFGSVGWRFIGIDELDQGLTTYWFMREKETK